MVENFPKDFTLALALFDAVPVILFMITATIVAIRFNNPIFLSGAALCSLAGLGKIVWKIIVVTKNINIPFFFYEFRVLMPLGFLLIIFSFIIVNGTINRKDVKRRLLHFPAVIFFIITVFSLIGMMIIKLTMDLTSLKTNWIAEITNTIAQGSLLLGVLTMKKHYREKAPEEDFF